MNINSLFESRAKEITISLYEKGMIKTWYRNKPEGWFLLSGIWSPFYIQLRNLCSYPEILRKIGEVLADLVHIEIPQATRLVGIAMGGIPIAVATSLSSGTPAAFTRKIDDFTKLPETNTAYGEHSNIEGELKDEDELIIIDDVVTKFTAKLQAISLIKNETNAQNFRNVKCCNVVVVVDRQQGASDIALEYGMKLFSLIPFRTQGIHWLRDSMTDIEYSTIVDYLENPLSYQKKSTQDHLRKLALKDCELK
jgi:orotate phosphoribosyltransferase